MRSHGIVRDLAILQTKPDFAQEFGLAAGVGNVKHGDAVFALSTLQEVDEVALGVLIQ
jgi:hypothetical protein